MLVARCEKRIRWNQVEEMKCMIFNVYAWIIATVGERIVHFVSYSSFFRSSCLFVCLFVAEVKVWIWCKQQLIHKQLWLIICMTQLNFCAVFFCNIDTTNDDYQMDSNIGTHKFHTSSQCFRWFSSAHSDRCSDFFWCVCVCVDRA